MTTRGHRGPNQTTITRKQAVIAAVRMLSKPGEGREDSDPSWVDPQAVVDILGPGHTAIDGAKDPLGRVRNVLANAAESGELDRAKFGVGYSYRPVATDDTGTAA